MSAFFSCIFDIITDPLGLPIDWWKEWLILLVIGEIAYRVAFHIVGDMYRSKDITTRTGGSFFHWLIRLIVFVVMWAVTYGVIWIGKLVIAHWAVALAVLGFSLFAGVMIVLFVHNRRKGGVSNA